MPYRVRRVRVAPRAHLRRVHRKVRRQRGRGFMDVLRKVHGFVRDNKLISRGLALIPHRYAQKGSAIASQLGYGKRRRRSMRGRGWLSGLANTVGYGLGQFGLGRRRRIRRVGIRRRRIIY